ncbi:MAG: hypothetical protein CVT77_12205 [Alphaproteobacteria bacterium HGW-Alphaproteobacteria-16]|nr:MAG: hypothetical protein CVT77_12205 [Alphaproteobacteria bacterium HGW-Alphaproteobacteria-16]
MTGLVSIPPATAPCTDAESCELLVHADGWFAPVDLHRLRDSMRVGTLVTDARLREAVLKAMTDALKDLAGWRTAWALEGVEHVSQVPGTQLDGESICTQHWRTAVFNFALAQLVETHRDISATGSGEDRAEERAKSADDYRRDGLHAVRDLLAITPAGEGQRSRIDVELI